VVAPLQSQKKLGVPHSEYNFMKGGRKNHIKVSKPVNKVNLDEALESSDESDSDEEYRESAF